MVKAQNSGELPEHSHFGTVVKPTQMMIQEHDHEGAGFREVSRLSNTYTPPEDACRTYRVAYVTFKEFEDDLHRHIHLENNILFSRALAMEKEITYE